MVTTSDHLQEIKFAPVPPYALPEHGAIMAATILNSPPAFAMSVFILRAFVGLRRAVLERRRLVHRVPKVERRLAGHDKRVFALARAVRPKGGDHEDL